MTTVDKFAKFTAHARAVLNFSEQESLRLNHASIDTSHLLLGLTHDGDTHAAKVLARFNVELEQVRSAIDVILSEERHRDALGAKGLAPDGKKAIELAVDEARRLRHHYVGTEHLLLGLIRAEEGIAASVLASLGVTLYKARAETRNVLWAIESTRLQAQHQSLMDRAKAWFKRMLRGA